MLLRHTVMTASVVMLATVGCECQRGNGLLTSRGELMAVKPSNSILVEPEIVSELTIDFGVVDLGRTGAQTLTLKNTGTGELTISRVEIVSGDALYIAPAFGEASAPFHADLVQAPVSPGQELLVPVRFTPVDGTLAYESVVRFIADGADESRNTVTVTLRAKTEIGNCDVPAVVDFGNVPVGETFSEIVELVNTLSNADLATVGDIAGRDGPAFGFAAGAPRGDIEIPSMGRQPVVLNFTPTEKRAFEATVSLRGAGSCRSVTVILKGTGVDDVLTWTPPTLRFGQVPPNFQVAREVKFVNGSNRPITLRNVRTTNTTDYTFTPAGATLTLPVGETTVTVSCSPAVAGVRNSAFTFDTGLTRTPRGSVALECTGGGPKIKVTPRPAVNFGRVSFSNGLGQASRRVAVQNIGSAPLFLGTVDMMGRPGQMPLYEVVPGNASTSASDFVVTVAPTYSSVGGLPATVGSNSVDLTVALRATSVGLKEAELVLHSNDLSEPTVRLTLTANVQVTPPCSYRVTPLTADFGLVPVATQRDIPVNITNASANASDICYLTNFQFLAGSAPEFSFATPPPTEKELLAGETYTVVLRTTPVSFSGTTPVTLTGVFSFDSTSPAQPNTRITMRTVVGPSCLTVTPNPLDFGTVRSVPPTSARCNSPARTFNLYNTCSTALTLRSLQLVTAAGAAAGTPSCPGGTACPEFFLVQTPTIPSTGLTLAPGAAPVQFQARYSPIDTGVDQGVVVMEVVQSGASVSYVANMTGRGDPMGLQTDTFTQDAQPKADILLVIDDSCSMGDKQASLAANFGSFMQYANSASVDYHLSATTTDISRNGVMIRAGTAGHVLTRATPNVSGAFSTLVNVGTSGSGTEMGLAPTVAALSSVNLAGQNAGFLRLDANLAVVVVSDAGDQSPQPLSYYQNILFNVKGFANRSAFTFSNIGPYLSSAPSGCSYDDLTGLSNYQALVTATGGVRAEICSTSWASTLQSLGQTAFGFRTQFFLNNVPDLTGANQLDVRINGQPVAAGGYTYDAVSNSVRFAPVNTPGPGQTLTVGYLTTCN
ncbi:MAG: choice-of-anchor D domain-containing protein [Archangium sp.]|nr:choice-of-anchor D domain-containing protein [Archangium sp.]